MIIDCRLLRFDISCRHPADWRRVMTHRIRGLLLSALFGIVTLMLWQVVAPAAQADLSRRIAHTDPAAFRPSPAVHGGAGTMAFTALLNRGAVTPEFNFLHRGE